MALGFVFLSATGGEADFMLAALWDLYPEGATQPPTEDADDAQATNRKERATAKRTAATTGDEDGTEEDNQPPATTAPATKRAGNRTQRPDTGTAANERRPGDANA